METDNNPFKLNTDVTSVLKSIKPSKTENDPKEFPISNLYELIRKLYSVQEEIGDLTKYYDLFEDISARLKEKGYYINPESKPLNENDLEEVINQLKEEKKMLLPPVKYEPESEPQPVTAINFIPDYLELFRKFSWSGINFGEKEMLLLNNSLKKLAIIKSEGNVSFFGKIYGTEKDYYIAEVTEVEPPENFVYDIDMEKRKEDGVNKNVFYVTNDLCGKWVELPDIKPSHIIAARKIKYMFTGDLERKICSNPQFNGVEKHYLRCQIARIYHSTKLVPSINHFVVEDIESQFKPLTPAEKLKPFTYEEIGQLKNWIHYPPGILQCGRISHNEPPENVEPDEYKNKVKKEDPFDKRIKPITEDDGIVINGVIKKTFPAWKINQMFEDSVYINPYIKLLDETQPDFDPMEQKDNKANYLLVSIKSLRWPGAVNFYNGKESFFFYFGYGQKFVDESENSAYVFKDFPVIPQEAPERDELPEPHEIFQAPQEEEKKEEEKKEEEPQADE